MTRTIPATTTETSDALERTSGRPDAMTAKPIALPCLTDEQRALLAKLDDLSPQQLRDALCYLIGAEPAVTGRVLRYEQPEPQAGAR